MIGFVFLMSHLPDFIDFLNCSLSAQAIIHLLNRILWHCRSVFPDGIQKIIGCLYVDSVLLISLLCGDHQGLSGDSHFLIVLKGLLQECKRGAGIGTVDFSHLKDCSLDLGRTLDKIAGINPDESLVFCHDNSSGTACETAYPPS